jgi:hypothetical protein
MLSVVIKFKNMTAEELWSKHFDGLHYDDITPEREQKYAIEFAKMKVLEAIELIKDNVNYGIYQNDDGQEPFHHESNIFVDNRTIDNAFDIDELCK